MENKSSILSKEEVEKATSKVLSDLPLSKETKFKKGDKVKYIGPAQSLYGKKIYEVLNSEMRKADGAEITSVREVGSSELGPTNRGADYSPLTVKKWVHLHAGHQFACNTKGCPLGADYALTDKPEDPNANAYDVRCEDCKGHDYEK